ncbi:MAG: PLDc N-terminal domain-containing protein [Candidatus Woesearchaeota archaeon]
MGLFGSLIGLIALVCAVWVIYEVVTKHKNWTDGKKLVWIVCAIVFNILTAIVYYFLEYKK